MARNIKAINTDSTEDIAAIDPININAFLDKIERSKSRFLHSLSSAQEFAPAGEEDLDAFQEEEEAAQDKFEHGYNTTKKLANDLLAMQQTQLGLAEFHDEVKLLEQSLVTMPDSDHSRGCDLLEASFTSLKQEWKKTHLPRTHPMKGEFDACTERFLAVGAEVSSAKRKSISIPIISSSPAVATKTEKNPTKLPAIALPTFSGDVLKWPTFWNQFVASVDSNADLPDSTKLSYLRRAIKDPEAEVIMNPSIDGPDTYSRLVKELHLRYRRTKKIHRDLVEKLIQLPSAKYNSSDLRRLVDAATNSLECLQTTGHFSLETFISSMIYSKLPYKLQVDWDKDQPDTDAVLPYLKLFEYVTKTAFTLSDHKSSTPSHSETKPPAKKQEKTPNRRPQKSQVYSVSTPTSDPSPTPATTPWKYECLLCKPAKHPLNSCPKWLGFTVDQRLTQVRDRKICANCLAPGHATSDCRSKYRCQDCRQKHHTSIHKDNDVQVSSTLTRSRQLPDALLMTAEVLLKGPGGHQLKARAFLDPGAGFSLISSRVAQLLELPLESSKTSFTTVQGTKCQGSNYLTTLTVSPLNNKRDFFCRPAVVKKVTEDIPNKLLAPVTDYPHLNGLHLADPTFNVPGRVDILLGAELWPQLQATASPVTASPTEPGAQATAFGWVLTGLIRAQETSTQDVATCHLQPMSNDELYNLAYDFWKAEAVEPPADPLSLVDSQIEKHYDETVTYSPTEQRYQVTMPRRSNCLPLGESRPQAVQRYYANETSIAKRGVKKDFQAQIQGYLDAGHAEPVPAAELDAPHFYLPMHSVVKCSSTSTKLRVVFDGSAHTSTGASLNNILHIGPTLQPLLSDTLMKFRTYPVALTADISKMYREVELHPTDRDLHRFVWRPTPQDDLKDFRMTRVTFGVSGSPYLAIKTLQQTAKDHGADHPTASNHIVSSFYVDDLLAGAPTAEDAKELFVQLRSVLQKGGFNLCKWRSSSPVVLNNIPTELREKLLTKDATSLLPSAQPKALGLQWDSQEDVMSPTIHAPSSYRQTKRGIISDISKTFDVLGWIAPAVLPMKILYQTLWEKGQEWDGLAPPSVIEEHSRWREQLPCLSVIKLRRCYTSHPQPIRRELHGFSDASKKASGAVVYLRTTYASHPPTVSLVSAKTKVAKRDVPKKKKKGTNKTEEESPQPPPDSDSPDESDQPEKDVLPSTNNAPRTELDAAVLLTKLLTNISAVLEIPLDHVTAWTDSSVVFAWLDGRQRTHGTFEANRISYILQHTEPKTWKHIPGEDNPADCASRGMTPSELLHHSLWWQGPSRLQEDPVPIPAQPPRKPIPEIKPIHATLPRTDFTTKLLVRTNEYPLLIDMTAWWFRFFKRLKDGRPSPDNRSLGLSLDEREAAEHWLLKQSQKRSFPTEYHALSLSGKTAPASRLRALTPMMTPTEGLIRVGGRLDHSDLSLSKKHPIILDGKDILIKKMFEFLHKKLCHGGPSLLLSHTSGQFHVLGARKLIRNLCSQCTVCRRVRPSPMHQRMGELPVERIQDNQPAFTNTGMDFSGPYIIRRGRGLARTEGHICVFVCLATKAIHLEVTSDLTTPIFIQCLRRFIARRNCPKTLHCDNGPNFVGARGDLERLYSFLADEGNDEIIRHYLLQNKVQWSHIPAASPHFGGLWESAVRSMKKHLRRLIGTIPFTYEELTTITCQVEACLNSRPLIPLTCHSPEGIVPLTAGHFLFLDAPNAYPTDPRLPEEPRLNRRWNQCQHVVQHFWDRWSREYLHTLQSRTKWQQIKPNLEPGDIVMYKPKDNFACRWPLATVTETYPGSDGLVRAVLIQPVAGEARQRPVTKLSLIYRKEDQDEHNQTTPTVASPGSMSRHGSPQPRQTGDNNLAARQPPVIADSKQPDNLQVTVAPKPPEARKPRTAPQRPPRRVQPTRACKQIRQQPSH